MTAATELQWQNYHFTDTSWQQNMVIRLSCEHIFFCVAWLWTGHDQSQMMAATELQWQNYHFTNTSWQQNIRMLKSL
jgi:hypothetical protein